MREMVVTVVKSQVVREISRVAVKAAMNHLNERWERSDSK